MKKLLLFLALINQSYQAFSGDFSPSLDWSSQAGKLATKAIEVAPKATQTLTEIAPSPQATSTLYSALSSVGRNWKTALGLATLAGGAYACKLGWDKACSAISPIILRRAREYQIQEAIKSAQEEWMNEAKRQAQTQNCTIKANRDGTVQAICKPVTTYSYDAQTIYNAVVQNLIQGGVVPTEGIARQQFEQDILNEMKRNTQTQRV